MPSRKRLPLPLPRVHACGAGCWTKNSRVLVVHSYSALDRHRSPRHLPDHAVRDLSDTFWVLPTAASRLYRNSTRGGGGACGRAAESIVCRVSDRQFSIAVASNLPSRRSVTYHYIRKISNVYFNMNVQVCLYFQTEL